MNSTRLSSPRKRGPICQNLFLWVPAFAGTTVFQPLTGKTMAFDRIAVVGAGAWGTALANATAPARTYS